MKYDATKVGSKIARGGDSIVYHYDTNQVIKFSILSKTFGKGLPRKLKRDYSICSEYFPDYMVKTRFTDDEIYNHIEIQEYIAGEELQIKHLENGKVKNAFLNILSIIAEMRKEGYASLDLIGNRGMRHPCFSNLIVKAESIYIVDAALMESKSVGFWGYVFFPLMEIGKLRQKYLIKRFLSRLQ